MPSPRPCIECNLRPKAAPRHRCDVCQLRHAPIGEQVEAARRRLALVPEELRRKRTKTQQALAPRGTAWCAGCQTFRDTVDFGRSATQCRACVSATTHAARIERVYSLDAKGYDDLLELQGGRCAICRARPQSKRLAVDHDHRTGQVRGLLCSRCNHDLMGSAWDSQSLAAALWWYLHSAPTTGDWVDPTMRPPLGPTNGRETGRETPQAGDPWEPPACARTHYVVGYDPMPGQPGTWRVLIPTDGPFERDDLTTPRDPDGLSDTWPRDAAGVPVHPDELDVIGPQRAGDPFVLDRIE